MTLATVLAFAAMAALLIMSPGPNGVLIAKTVPTSGRAAGFATIAGFVAAFFVHGTFAIFGLSVLLLQSAQLFTAVKLIGAAYLVWIGLKALREAWRGAPAKLAQVAPARRRRTLAKAFGEGFLTNALNPKVAMFYVAAFPQFAPPDVVSPLSAYLLVVVHACLNVTWFGPIVLLFDRLSAAARAGSVQRAVKAVTGLVFVGFGLKLATWRP
ncbi:LysE family translocator [Aquibium sp. ELW1220]|jgi:threonine/homoserine/homoserine lactone efflux protein|uniref:LysE family translocator n=1 Tax=Aquibium sp. ELW1220 TaxID=2976766 RepID=UPI0025AF6528|nr:LysE family translocator [Aquibium sp. ELW1220]MDN2583638.1 LysE family translocator [Aquibium sp. ELW1220]